MPVRFSISESGRGEDLEENLIALEYRLFDLKPLAEIAQEVMEWQNEQGALAGVDQYGHTYDKLAPATLRRRNGTGPPLAPQGPAARIINFFETDVTPGFDEYTVRGHWPGLPWIRFHKTGAPANNMPERDPIGMRPIGWDRLSEEFRAWVRGLLDGGHGSGPSAPRTTGGGGPSGGGSSAPAAPAASGPLAPTASNGPGIGRHDTPDDDDLMIDLPPAWAVSGPLAPTKANGPGLVRHETPEAAGSPPSPSPSLPEPPRYSGAKFVYEGATEAKLAANIERALGPGATARHAAAVAGIPEDARRVEVSSGFGGSVVVNARTTSGVMTREILLGDTPTSRSTTIKNEFFELNKDVQGGGLGTVIFARQVEAAAGAGFTKIKTHAAAGGGLNGYYTWIRMGYDGTVPRSVRPKLPAHLAGVTRLSDLMKTAEGRAAWKEHGTSVHVSFDLRPGSLSRKVLDAYVKERGLRP